MLRDVHLRARFIHIYQHHGKRKPSVTVGYTGAYEKLVRKKPPDSLMKTSNIVSIMVQVLVTAAFQLGVLFYLREQP